MGQSDKKFYWIKLRTDFFQEDSPIDFLMSQENGAQYVVLYQMLCLKTANMNGQLSTQIGEVIIPYDIKKIVRDTKYFDVDTVTVALELFKKIGLIYQQEDGNLVISNYSHMVGSESASKSAIIKRNQREKQAEKLLVKDITNSEKDNEVDSEVDNAKDSEVDKMSNRDKRLEIRDKDNREKEKKEKNKKEKVFLSSYHFSDSEVVQSAFDEFLATRIAMKKPMTERAILQLKTKLESLSKDEYTQADILDQSVFRTWDSVYPLSPNYVSMRVRPQKQIDTPNRYADYQ